jgi:hypothetical protein
MRRLIWKPEKNEKLKRERGISFENMEEAIAEGGLLDVLENPAHPNRLLLVISLDGYVHAVSASVEEDLIWLWTAFPSRKLEAVYGGDQ